MGILNLNKRPQVPDYQGRGSPEQRAYIYQDGTDTLAPVYADEGLTIMTAQPLRASADGLFPICYLMNRKYDLKIQDARQRVLLELPDLRIHPGTDAGYVRVFQTVDELMKDTTLLYSGHAANGHRADHQEIQPDDFVLAVRENCTFRIAGPSAQDHHLETENGLRLYLADRVWPAAAFGVTADSDPLGQSGTDNAQPLASLAAALSNRDEAIHVVFPKGIICSSGTFNVESDVLREIHVSGEGTKIVFTHPEPALNRRYFSVRNTAMAGARCSIRGLTLDLARNPIRTGGSDMVSIGGFADVDVSHCVIPSADNMGISIDRGLPSEARSVRVQNNRIGGKAPVSGTTHEYGSIGDTGIWVLHAGYGTVISGNVIYGTGDDAIAIAETSVSPSYAPAVISDNIVKNCQGTAYKSGAGYTTFSGNYAENTRNDMYRLIDLAIGGGTTVPAGFQVLGGYGKDIGTATAESLGVDVALPALHCCGVMLENTMGNGSVVALRLENVAGHALKIISNRRPAQDIELRACTFKDCGSSLIKREGGTASFPVTNVTIADNVVRNAAGPLLAWECKLTSGTEGGLLWQGNEIIDCDFSGTSTAFLFVGPQTARLANIRIRADRWTNSVRPSSCLIDLGGASPGAFEFWFHDDEAVTALPMGNVRMRNSQNPGAIGLGPECRARRGCRKTIPATREFNDGNVLLTLDPQRGWEVEAKAIRNSDGSYGAISYRACWDPVYGQVLHETSQGGGPDGNCAVELIRVVPDDPEDQVFSGTDVLQLQGTASGWTSSGAESDPLINFQVSWREVVDNDHPIKID